MKSQQKKCDIAAIAGLSTAILVTTIILIVYEFFHPFHTWSFQNVDGTNVQICLECGEVKEIECKHQWEAQKVDGKFIAYCAKCGKNGK